MCNHIDLNLNLLYVRRRETLFFHPNQNYVLNQTKLVLTSYILSTFWCCGYNAVTLLIIVNYISMEFAIRNLWSGGSRDEVVSDENIEEKEIPSKERESLTMSIMSTDLDVEVNVQDIVADCEAFMKQVREQMNESRTPSRRFSFFSTDAPLQDLDAIMTGILQKIEVAEEKLRTRMIEMTEKKAALKDQAAYLKDRVESCILYNRSEMDSMEKQSSIIRKLVNDYSDRCSSLKVMLSFSEDVVKLSQREQRNKSDMEAGRFIPAWRLNAPLDGSVVTMTTEELCNDENYAYLDRKLEQMRSMRTKLANRLKDMLESKESLILALSDVSTARRKLCHLLHIDEGQEIGQGNGTDDIHSSDVKFDHKQCHDCYASSSLTSDCAEHLQRVTADTIEITRRLTMVVEIRERVRDIWEARSSPRSSSLNDANAMVS
jgi:hypothetical protein